MKGLFVAGALLAALVLAVHSRALGNGFVSLDDEPYVTANPEVRAGLSFGGIRWAFTTTCEANWHPLTWISHMADVGLYGLEPFGHHLTNVLIHAVNALLVLLLFSRMTGRVWASAMVAALFAVHPLRVESVAWVAERKDVLCALFGLLSVLAYVRYARGRRREAYLAALGFFALGLLSKPMLVTLPFLLLLLDYWPLERVQRSGWPRLLLEKVPLLALSAASCIVTMWAQGKGGAIADTSLPLAARFSNAPLSYLAYLEQSLVPVSLSVLYPHPGSASLVAVAAAALLVALSLGAIRFARALPYLAVGWFWFLGALVPVIGLVQVGWQARADRYTYLPSLGLALAVVWGVSDLWRRFDAPQWLLGVAAAFALCVLSFLTWRQIGYWKDSPTLFAHGLEVTERNHILHINLGIEQVRRGQLEDAIGHFRRAVAIEPGYWYGQLALGSALVRANQQAEAVACLETALHQHPDSAEARSALEVAREKLGRDTAPDSAALRYERARALIASGRKGEAKDELRAALRLSPEFPPAATLLVAMLATDPDTSPSEGEEALGLARQLALQSGNRDPNALDLLAAAQAQVGRYAEAVKTAKRAIGLADASGQKNLSRVIAERLAFYRAGRPYRAVSP